MIGEWSPAALNLPCIACFQGLVWTPSKMIQRLGKEINNTDSVYYWAYRVSRFKLVF
jgi:deoxyhypusine synthase